MCTLKRLGPGASTRTGRPPADMCGRTEYFTALLRLVRELCRPECGGPLLARRLPEDCEGGASLAGAVAGLATPAAQYVRVRGGCVRGWALVPRVYAWFHGIHVHFCLHARDQPLLAVGRFVTALW